MWATISIIVLAIICIWLIVKCENLREDATLARIAKESYKEDWLRFRECIPYIPICMVNKKKIQELSQEWLTWQQIWDIFWVDGSTVNKWLAKWKKESCVKS